MWPIFALDFLIAIAMLYFPGFLILSQFRFHQSARIIFSPLFSMLLLTLSAALLSLLNLSSQWHVVLFVSAMPALIAAITKLLYRSINNRVSTLKNNERRMEKGATDTHANEMVFFEPKTALLYVIISLCVGYVIFIRTLDTPLSVFQENDCFFHLNLIRHSLESGLFFDISQPGYPQAWHVITALVANAYGNNVGIAVNAVNFALIAVVFPLGMYFFMSQIVQKSLISLWGAFCVLAFTAYPWGLLVFGPLYPNLASLAVLPIATSLYIRCFQSSSPLKTTLVRFSAFAVSCLGLAMIHPGSIFVGITLLTPYTVSALYLSANPSLAPLSKRVIRIVLFLLFVAAVWVILFLAPPLSGTVWFHWPAYLSKTQAVVSGALLALTKASAPQLVLAGLTIIGFIYSLYTPKYRWLAASYIIALVMRFVNVTTDGFLKHLLTGFWYTDEFRVAALVALAGIPLATLGIFSIVSLLDSLINTVIKPRNHQTMTRIVNSSFIVFLAIAIYMPNYQIPMNQYVVTGFGQTTDMLRNGNSLQPGQNAYDYVEYQFIEQVAAIVPEDSKIVNVPFDGSIYAYGLNGVDTYFNKWYGYEDEPADSTDSLIRNSLCDYYYDENVRAAVEEAGVTYVLLLEDDYQGQTGLYLNQYNPSDWVGITSITENTPGFELVLAGDGMSLYKIVPE